MYNNAKGCQDFPHESTADQFFSESQFESYRALGYHTLQQIWGRPGTAMELAELVEQARAYVGGAPEGSDDLNRELSVRDDGSMIHNSQGASYGQGKGHQ